MSTCPILPSGALSSVRFSKTGARQWRHVHIPKALLSWDIKTWRGSSWQYQMHDWLYECPRKHYCLSQPSQAGGCHRLSGHRLSFDVIGIETVYWVLMWQVIPPCWPGSETRECRKALLHSWDKAHMRQFQNLRCQTMGYLSNSTQKWLGSLKTEIVRRQCFYYYRFIAISICK